ncbi:MAG: hypothetical protein EOM20_11630 [Spartobacteria bacterium]|nr:hypothetical protein [Spartobacteria bacterium]
MQPGDKEQPEHESVPSEGAPYDDIPIHIDGYELVREMNEGGQAIVFQAVKISTGRKVAIKILIDELPGSEVERTRMETEVRILAALDHSNIVSVIDRGETEEGWPFFVMEYVQGNILAEHIDEMRENDPVPGIAADYTDMLRLFVRICDAVNAAHLRGIVHRDLKPSNIVVDSYGEPHILDFGVARAPLAWLAARDGEEDGEPVSGEFLGSLQWASPEQIEAEPDRIDIRSDVYSLGVILYEMLTGAFPYEVFGSVEEVMHSITEVKPEPPSVVLRERMRQFEKRPGRKRMVNPIGPELDAVVLKALAKAPADRYQSAGELARAVTACMDRAANTPASISLLRKWALPLIIIGALLCMLALMFFVRKQPEAPAVEPPPVPTPVVVQQDNIFGYRIEGDQVVFEFDPREYHTARMADGSLGPLQSVEDIYTVNVAGPFNDWIKDDADWSLGKLSRNQFVLRKAVSNFAARAEWPFKFVINNAIWVGAPPKAENKMVVAEDTATYNLILTNPYLASDQGTALLRMYRDRINRVWPGQGWNLTINSNNQYLFTLTHVKEARRIDTLDALRGVPLYRLDLGETRIRDFSALAGMTNLTCLTCNDAVYYALTGGILPALEQDDFDRAAERAGQVFASIEEVPACRTFRAFLAAGIANMQALAAHPESVPEGAYRHEGHRYAYILLPMKWAEADAYARRCGGYLAAITSPEEQAWITKTFGWGSLGRTTWLGGTDADSEGRWTWVNGEPWEYTNWTPPEPNNNNDNEHYLAMKPDGWWMDVNGDAVNYPFLIEWE